MSTFSEVWDSASIGDTITVSNGDFEPVSPTSRLHKIWRSNNFTGELVEKIAASETPPRPRRLRITYGSTSVAYDVPESGGHTFTIA